MTGEPATSKVEFRIDVPLQVRNDFRDKCRRMKLSMSAVTSHLMQQWNQSDAQPIDATDAEPQAVLDLTIDSTASQVDPLQIKALTEIFDARFAEHRQLLKLIIDRQDQPYSLAKKTNADVEQLCGQAAIINSRLDKIQQHRANAIKASVDHPSPVRALIFGIGLGVSSLLVLLWLVSGTGVARWVAIEMTGEGDRIAAAEVILGRGSQFEGSLVRQSSALITDPEYGLKFARCVKKAKTATDRTPCALSLPPLGDR